MLSSHLTSPILLYAYGVYEVNNIPRNFLT